MSTEADPLIHWEQLRQADWLAAAMESTLDDFRLQTELRKTYPADLVILALQLREGRRKLADKFTRADDMWLTRLGAEQSTAETVARHKAQRFAGCHEVWDLCCGIGGDSIALAEHVPAVQAVDRSAVNCLWTRWNAGVYGVGDRIRTQSVDVTTLSLADKWVHIDPDRRAGTNRAMRLEQYEPALEFLQGLTTQARGGAIKLSPASNFGGKFPDCEVELISLSGECKEATVWFGDRRSDEPWRATLLPSGATLTGDPFLARGEVQPLGQFLYDPDPAVVRAGLIDVLAESSGLGRLDPAEEYLTSESLIDTPFARPFEVLANVPHNDRDLRRLLSDESIGELEIKCRHVPVDVNAFRKRLKLQGTQKRVLFIARLEGKTRYVLAKRH